MSYTGSKAQAGRGTILSIGTAGSPITYTNIGEVKSSGISGTQWGTADTTNFNSGADQEFITTVRNNGSMKLDMNRVASDAGQLLLETAYNSGAVTPFKITLPQTTGQTSSGDSYTFNALVESRDLTVSTTDIVSLSVSLKISGAVTFTAGS